MEQIKNKDDIITFARSIEWLGQAAVRIRYRGVTVYIDPFQLKSPDTAAIILITHDHFDHLSPEDLAKIAGKNTRFVAATACVEKLKQAGYGNIMAMTPGSKITLGGIHITAVPAYNVTRNMHPKEKQYVGYIVDFGGITVYHTGDTERVPEMKEIRCDIMLVPLGQTYTMTSVEEAAGAVLDTKATVAIPIHWGYAEGAETDAKRFREILQPKGVTVMSGKQGGLK
ncbi:MAG TPA: MBL fold metallo-hydrolase [Bacteroidales bacterium]|nr:MBL fold metallo-hydrolase [Bacteroidales bacterium]